LAEIGAEFLFQVIAERSKKAAVIVTTNRALLGMDPGDSQRPALQGLVDRITDRANIIRDLPPYPGKAQEQMPECQELIPAVESTRNPTFEPTLSIESKLDPLPTCS
jgi:hypothetical protein